MTMERPTRRRRDASHGSAERSPEVPETINEAAVGSMDKVIDSVTDLFQASTLETSSDECNMFADVRDKSDPTNDLPQRGDDVINHQISHLKEIFGLWQDDSGPETSLTEPSFTLQFAKLAAVFATLVQRVMRSQKKAKKTQAFCDALLAENEKMKSALKHEKQQAIPPFPCKAINAKLTTPEATTEEPESVTLLKQQERIKRLERQRSEILRVNKTWDTQYKRLKQELDRRTREWECRIQNFGESSTSPCSEEGQDDVTMSLSEARRRISGLIKEKAELTRNCTTAHARCQTMKLEIQQLKKNEKILKSSKSCLEAENLRLSQVLEASYSIHERRSLNPEDHPTKNNQCSFPWAQQSRQEEAAGGCSGVEDLRTQIEVLQEQVKIYKEDFETERRDREMNQDEKQRLDEDLIVARRELQTLTHEVRKYEQKFRQEERNKIRLQRQIQWYQTKLHDPFMPWSEDHGDVGDPPVYQTHRHRDDETTAFDQFRSGRRAHPTFYNAGHNPTNWG